MSATDQIAAYVVGACYEAIPPEVVTKVKEQLVYHLGLALARSLTDDARQMRDIMQPVAPARGATVVGERFRLGASDAAFANCTLMSATGQDDVIFPA